MRQNRDRKGFVLLMVLMVLAIAAAVLAGTARRSGRAAIEAAGVLRDLQVRWGAASCKQFMLDHTEQLLARRNASCASGRSRSEKRFAVRLGGIDFELILCDEQAKPNANVIAARFAAQGLQAALSNLQARRRNVLRTLPQPGTGQRTLLLRSQLHTPSGSAKPTGPARGPAMTAQVTTVAQLPQAVPVLYESYDQLFELHHPSQLLAGRDEQSALTLPVTCWGDGRLNFKVAGVAAMRAVLGDLLSEQQIRQLHEFASEKPNCTLAEALGALKLDHERAAVVSAYLTDTSRCFALWVIAHGRTRNWYRLYVIDTSGGAARQVDWSW